MRLQGSFGEIPAQKQIVLERKSGKGLLVNLQSEGPIYWIAFHADSKGFLYFKREWANVIVWSILEHHTIQLSHRVKTTKRQRSSLQSERQGL